MVSETSTVPAEAAVEVVDNDGGDSSAVDSTSSTTPPAEGVAENADPTASNEGVAPGQTTSTDEGGPPSPEGEEELTDKQRAEIDARAMKDELVSNYSDIMNARNPRELINAIKDNEEGRKRLAGLNNIMFGLGFGFVSWTRQSAQDSSFSEFVEFFMNANYGSDGSFQSLHGQEFADEEKKMGLSDFQEKANQPQVMLAALRNAYREPNYGLRAQRWSPGEELRVKLESNEDLSDDEARQVVANAFADMASTYVDKDNSRIEDNKKALQSILGLMLGGGTDSGVWLAPEIIVAIQEGKFSEGATSSSTVESSSVEPGSDSTPTPASTPADSATSTPPSDD